MVRSLSNATKYLVSKECPPSAKKHAPSGPVAESGHFGFYAIFFALQRSTGSMWNDDLPSILRSQDSSALAGRRACDLVDLKPAVDRNLRLHADE